MENIIEIKDLNKTYEGGFQALKSVSLNIKKNEIFALLGPNGAGKTTMISIICGLVNPTSGSVTVNGHDIIKEYRASRELIGLVPQELTTDAFEKVKDTVSHSRGLFGKKPNPELVERLLKQLSLWDKRNNRLMTLSGGMKRRLMIAKALSHEPQILFLDEPSAGVDVELRKDMWQQVRELRDSGVTIILTTHYIEEAEKMADRIGVVRKGELVVVEEKNELMKKLGKKRLRLQLSESISELPSSLSDFDLTLEESGRSLSYVYDVTNSNGHIQEFLEKLAQNNIKIIDMDTKQSSLEEIFVSLVNQQ